MPKRYRNKIGQKWKSTREAVEVRNPFGGRPVAEVTFASAEQCEDAIAQAQAAFETTRKMSAHARSQVCAAVAAGIAKRADELSELVTAEAGKPIQYSRGEVERATQTFLLASEEAKRMGGEVIPVDISERTEGYLALTSRFPRGPLAAVTPFNFPLNLVAHKLAPALATGTPCIIKPSRQAPLSALVLAEICEDAGWPGGALSVLYCEDDVAEKLVTDPRIPTFSFTGSDRVGWMLKEKAPRKHVVLELGGDAAAIVAEDADLAWAVPRCAIGAFAYAGQICISVQRILVHESRYEEFLSRFLDQAARLPVGDPKDPATVVGPVIEEAAANRIEAAVAGAIEAGAKRLLGGRREGNLLWPTVLTDVPPESAFAKSEIFGPVVSVAPYKTDEEALSRVNASRFGLQAGVFTANLQRAFRAFGGLEVGGLIVNDYPMFRTDNYPYGGVKDSGMGREGVRPAMDELTDVKTLVIRT